MCQHRVHVNPRALSADAHDLKAFTGRSRPPNPAFLASLTGDAAYKAAGAFWLAIVLPAFVQTSAGNASIAIRLCTYVFVPGMIIAADLEDVDAPFFPLPLPLGEFLRKLLAKGLPSAVLASPHEAQLLVIEYAKLLSDADRMLARLDVCTVTAAGTVLEGITPSLLKGSDASNSMRRISRSIKWFFCFFLSVARFP